MHCLAGSSDGRLWHHSGAAFTAGSNAIPDDGAAARAANAHFRYPDPENTVSGRAGQQPNDGCDPNGRGGICGTLTDGNADIGSRAAHLYAHIPNGDCAFTNAHTGPALADAGDAAGFP